MATQTINPFGQTGELPAGYPIADDLETNSAQKALSARQGKRLKEMMAQPSRMPTLLKMSAPTEVIYTIDDFILAHEYTEGQGDGTLKFSNDLGKTWKSKANTFGVIVNAFMFADGTFMMAAKLNNVTKFYWSRDFETFNDCTVIDYDGTSKTSFSGTRGYTPNPSYKHTYVDGVEFYCFWDYIITTTQPRAWYAISDENGVTIRAAFAFGLSTLDGNTIPARHVHAFVYNPYNKYFYILTGDHNEVECNVMRGRCSNNVWTWERLAYGQEYKVISPYFDEGNMYVTTDYTDERLADKKGVLSVPIDRINYNNFRYWFKATASFMGNAALTYMIVDNHGWRFAVLDYQGGTRHLIAKGDHNFVWVDNNSGYKFSGIIGPNNKGDVYVTFKVPGASVSGEDWLNVSHRKTFNLTEAMRNSGATDFFEGYVQMPV